MCIANILYLTNASWQSAPDPRTDDIKGAVTEPSPGPWHDSSVRINAAKLLPVSSSADVKHACRIRPEKAGFWKRESSRWLRNAAALCYWCTARDRTELH